MSCIENFSWIATEWNMHKSTIADSSLAQMCDNQQFGAYVIRCIDRFNEVTAHLATLSIRNYHELQECIKIIQHLNNMDSRDDYADSINGMLSNVSAYLNQTGSNTIPLRLVA